MTSSGGKLFVVTVCPSSGRGIVCGCLAEEVVVDDGGGMQLFGVRAGVWHPQRAASGVVGAPHCCNCQRYARLEVSVSAEMNAARARSGVRVRIRNFVRARPARRMVRQERMVIVPHQTRPPAPKKAACQEGPNIRGRRRWFRRRE
jgi:hypothetical protein